MIHVEVLKNDSLITGFRVSGHAGFEEEGRDIVCAGVSAITQTALLGLEEFAPEGFRWRIEQDGYLECYLNEDMDETILYNAQIILLTMLRGLEAIQDQYGDFIGIAVQEVK